MGYVEVTDADGTRPALCALCEKPVASEDVVVLEDLDGEGRWAVVAVGLAPGHGLSGEILTVHGRCLKEKGQRVSAMPPMG